MTHILKNLYYLKKIRKKCIINLNQKDDFQRGRKAMDDAVIPFDEMKEILKKAWCKETCAPRLREKWTKENKTLGQCSVTAFLLQDYYGGEVYAIRTLYGRHCYNVIGGNVIDTTAEQFGCSAKELVYNPSSDELQNREMQHHFGDNEKKNRYELLKKKVSELIEVCYGNEEK